MTSHAPPLEPESRGPGKPTDVRLHHACDRCGAVMVSLQCKIICLNCGHRLDCSDLNIYFD